MFATIIIAVYAESYIYAHCRLYRIHKGYARKQNTAAHIDCTADEPFSHHRPGLFMALTVI